MKTHKLCYGREFQNDISKPKSSLVFPIRVYALSYTRECFDLKIPMPTPCIIALVRFS